MTHCLSFINVMVFSFLHAVVAFGFFAPSRTSESSREEQHVRREFSSYDSRNLTSFLLLSRYR
jgi:hypothetical protein